MREPEHHDRCPAALFRHTLRLRTVRAAAVTYAERCRPWSRFSEPSSARLSPIKLGRGGWWRFRATAAPLLPMSRRGPRARLRPRPLPPPAFRPLAPRRARSRARGSSSGSSSTGRSWSSSTTRLGSARAATSNEGAARGQVVDPHPSRAASSLPDPGAQLGRGDVAQLEELLDSDSSAAATSQTRPRRARSPARGGIFAYTITSLKRERAKHGSELPDRLTTIANGYRCAGLTRRATNR